jgi:hypothetical protein
MATTKTRKPKPPTIHVYFADDKKTQLEIERVAKQLGMSVSTFAKLSIKAGMPIIRKSLTLN